MKKIVIVSGLPITANPRAKKEADALSDAGYQVEIIGAIYDKKTGEAVFDLLKEANWKYCPVVDLSKKSLINYSLFFYARLRRKFWRLINQYFKVETYHQLGYFPWEIYKSAISKRADLYIVHAEESLLAGCKLLDDGFQVAVDIEDWYSEDALPEDRVYRPVKLMREYESKLLSNASFSMTTSDALSSILTRIYHCDSPLAIYNSFPYRVNKRYISERRSLKVPSIVWFSRTVGPGRGLEQLIEALSLVVHPFELHIRGDSRRGYNDFLINLADNSIRKHIFFHPQVSEEDLVSSLQGHTIGYCGELSDCKNHDFTISNKIMEYLSAGLLVLATDTVGQKEVHSKMPKSVIIFQQKSTLDLVNVLNSLLINIDEIENIKRDVHNDFENHYLWERSAEKICQLVDKSFETG